MSEHYLRRIAEALEALVAQRKPQAPTCFHEWYTFPSRGIDHHKCMKCGLEQHGGPLLRTCSYCENRTGGCDGGCRR